MSNEILFNSDALNSLKRAQLVKLCKRYGIKSTGKNPELVAKLRAYAETLPPTATFSCPSEADLLSSPSKQTYIDEANSEDEGSLQSHTNLGRVRPSDQWEPVSDTENVYTAETIPEESESVVSGSLRSGTSVQSGKSAQEFGNKTGGKVVASSSKSSITSSLKSIASSFIRSNKPAPAPPTREPSPPPPSQRETTPPPVQDSGPHTVRLIATPAPLPRSRSAADLLEGVSLPAPSFDKVAADLAQADAALAESSDTANGARISFGFGSAGYDDDAADVSMGAITCSTADAPSKSVGKEYKEDISGGFPSTSGPLVDNATADYDALQSPAVPFVFGHPRHSVSNNQFGDAAIAVLREMNVRMGVTSPTQAISLEQLEGALAGKGAETGSIARTGNRTDIRFGTQHEKEFAKMDSIANHYSVASKKRKSHHQPMSTESQQNKIFTLPSHVVAPPSVPERATKRARMSTVDGEEPTEPHASTSAEQTSRDSTSVRASLERKPRSSAARTSVGGARKSTGINTGRKSGARQPPVASSRFGFVSRMVRSVWGGGSDKKEKEKGKEQEKQKEKEKALSAELKSSTSITKSFPSVPKEQPVHIPTFPSAPKTKPVSAIGMGMGRPSSVVPKNGHVRIPSIAKLGTGTGKPEEGQKSTGASRGAALPGAARASSGTSTNGTSAPRTRPVSTLLAPTAASLARQGSVASKTAALPKPSTITKPSITTAVSRPSTAGPATVKSTSRPLPVPPTSVGRAATSGAAVAGSARMASPPVRASSVASRAASPLANASATSPPAARKSTTRKSMAQPVRSPSGAKPRQSIFKNQLTVDAMTMRGAAPTVQPFRLSPQANMPSTVIPPASPTLAIKSSTMATTTRNTGAGPAKPQRRPRISRSKVIAKLGEKRAAVAAASKSAALSPNSKVRNSAHLRRSLGTVAARKALDADMELRARVRKSEAVRRQSKVVVGRRSEGAVLKRSKDLDVNMGK